MCMGSTPTAPPPPPVAPEAPTMPNVSGGQDAGRRRRLVTGNMSTILTGSRGVTDNASVSTKTLLGQ